ncbi:alpha/beta hydrolase [Alteribacillus iranensis]|mgnify:CR=1 FL=1|uniref:Lysophospholipase n=1 Tax=Alteribacillus iranensis TaxID=930128 RepID=A0A1I2ER23_9BACI|nr:alpha/beta hydrolase [Alteribacillus iranensis]SFE95269.1 lysophospholipase [Alteribacillus iranensis]
MMKQWMSERARGTVVVIHGAGEHHGRYKWLFNQLNQQRFHVVSGDLPGHGRTRGKRGHIDSFDQYIEAVYEWYKEASSYELPIFLFGHSMGGLISIRALMEKYMPVKGLVLSSPCLGLYEYPNRMAELATKMLHRVTPSLTAKTGIHAERITRNPDVRKEYQEDELNITTVTARWYQEMVKAMRIAYHQTDRFPDIPLLVMQAGEDYIVDQHATHRWFNRLETKDRSIKEWKGLYHELLNEPEREEVLRFMINFLHVRM